MKALAGEFFVPTTAVRRLGTIYPCKHINATKIGWGGGESLYLLSLLY